MTIHFWIGPPRTEAAPKQFLANIDVNNIEKAIYFYQSAFWLKIERRCGAKGVEMLGSSAPIYLLVKQVLQARCSRVRATSMRGAVLPVRVAYTGGHQRPK